MEKNFRTAFADLLNKLMEESDYSTNAALEGKSKVPRSNIHRFRNGESEVGLEAIFKLAKAFNLKGWELLKMLESEPKAAKGEDWVKPLTKGQKALKQMVDTLVATIPDDQALALAHMIKVSAMKGAPIDEHTEVKPKRSAKEHS